MNSAALLERQGWRGQGYSLDPTDRGLARPLLITQKTDSTGLGTQAVDFGNQWWLKAWDKPSTEVKSTSQLYSGFVRSETQLGTFPATATTPSTNAMAARNNEEPKDLYSSGPFLYSTSLTEGQVLGDVASLSHKEVEPAKPHKISKKRGYTEDEDKEKAKKPKHNVQKKIIHQSPLVHTGKATTTKDGHEKAENPKQSNDVLSNGKKLAPQPLADYESLSEPTVKEPRRAPRTIRKEKIAAKREAQIQQLRAEGKPIPYELLNPENVKGKKKKQSPAERAQMRKERKEKIKKREKRESGARKAIETENLWQEAVENAAQEAQTNLPPGQMPLPPADMPLKMPYVDPSTINPSFLPDGRKITKNLSMAHFRKFLIKEGLKQSMINAYIQAYERYKEDKKVAKEQKKAERRAIRKVQRSKPKSQKRNELEEKRARKEAKREARIAADPKLQSKQLAKERKDRNLAINTGIVLRMREAEKKARGEKVVAPQRADVKQARREARRIQRHAKKGRLTEDEIPQGFTLKRSYQLKLKGNGGGIPSLDESFKVRNIHGIGNGGPSQQA